MKFSLSLLLLLSFTCWLYPLKAGFAAGQRPLSTESAVTLSPGTLEIELGVDFLRNQSFPFPTSAPRFNRDLWEIPVIGLHLGVDKRTEVQFDYELLYLNESSPGVGEKFGSGDLKVFTKIQILEDRDSHPALGLRFGTKLPNADDVAHLGTNETDFLSSLLVTKFYQGVTFHANAGLGILGNPFHAAQQDDVLLLGFASILPVTPTLHFVMEIAGQTLSSKRNNVTSMRLGLQYQTGEVQWDLGGSVRLTNQAADWEVLSGLTWRIRLWGR